MLSASASLILYASVVVLFGMLGVNVVCASFCAFRCFGGKTHLVLDS